MALKKDNLPVNVDVDTEQGSSITYANEVVAIIAGVAANEVVAMPSTSLAATPARWRALRACAMYPAICWARTAP